MTQVLESVGIIDYSFIPEADRQGYLDRGRRVHAMTHYDDEGDLDPETVHHDDAGYLAAWRRCKVEMKFQMAVVECRRFDATMRYAGTLDRLTRCMWLLDIKTGTSPWWVGMQLAAYNRLLGTPTFKQASVELHEDGTYTFKPIRVTEQRQHENSYLACLRVYHVIQRKNGAL